MGIFGQVLLEEDENGFKDFKQPPRVDEKPAWKI
jgi:hypothetical protein